MSRILVAGAGTDVGKTIVSAILTTMLKGDYWKPIQCGEESSSDSVFMESLIDTKAHRIYRPAYSLKTPVSPHHAARLEGVSIDCSSIVPPETTRPLIIEGVGGVSVPLTTKVVTLDLFKGWNCLWVVVSRHYVGSINHTLLTVEALKQRQIPVAGLVFNGEPNPDTEAALLTITQLPCLGRLLPEANLNAKTIQKYAQLWHSNLPPLTL